jgi:CRISPR-associated protein Cmr2
LNRLPGAFYISFFFTLKTDFLTQASNPFHFFDNALHHDPVYKLPVYEASSWKGVLNHAILERIKRLSSVSDQKSVRDARRRLFGTETNRIVSYLNDLLHDDTETTQPETEPRENGNERMVFKGRVWCFPTFFRRRSLQIINPHDRERRAGTVPVTLECVPAGSHGLFQLLYFPHDRFGHEPEMEWIYDYHIICQAIHDALITFGIGGKHLAGLGHSKQRVHDVYIRAWGHPVEDVETLDDLKTSAIRLRDRLGVKKSQ